MKGNRKASPGESSTDWIFDHSYIRTRNLGILLFAYAFALVFAFIASPDLAKKDGARTVSNDGTAR
jgi:hypothetical protein